MCIIVDANVFHRVLRSADDPDYYPVQHAIFGKHSGVQRLILGGTVCAEELKKDEVASRIVLRLDQMGRVQLVSSSSVDAEAATLASQALCKSNDHHVIALARIAGARILCSADGALVADFKNKALIDNPRGRVYSKPSHRRLLTAECTQRCGGTNQCRK